MWTQRRALIGPTVSFIGLLALLAGFSGCGGPPAESNGNSGRQIDTPLAAELDGPDQNYDFPDPFAGEPEDPVTAPIPAPDRRREGVSIVLGTFSVDDHRANAETVRQQILAASDLTDVWIDSTTERSIVRYGAYESFTSAEARADLKRVKEIQVGNARPFVAAFLAPIGTGDAGDASAYNLVRVRDRFPNVDTLYSLQIAAFQSEPRREARRAAEQLVAQLRSEGEEAYYYHGRSYSHVTIGVFFADAVDPETGLYSPEVLAVRDRFPYNALNGREIIEVRRMPNGQRREVKQESFLVPVPRP